jgi:hypothetical protein
MFGI